ncbi:membrane protein insertase YidC [soil metagenome]
MDLFAFPPIGALLQFVYSLVSGLAALVTPLAGSAAAALAIVVLTLIVRTLLIPVSISQVKAEWHRRRIAPKLKALQDRYKKKPQVLQEKTMALYKAENVSPFAGFLPTLLQAPVVSLVYALFLHSTIAGEPNTLLTAQLGPVTLGSSVFTAGWPGVLVFLALFAVMSVVAWLSRRTALRLALPGTDATGLLPRILSWLPFLSVAFAAFVPLAAALYLATTTAWTLVERALLRRRYWGDRGVAGAVASPAR